MQWIRTWAVCLCAAATVAGIFLFLKPSAKFASVFKMALAAFFIAALINPFSVSKIDLQGILSPSLSEEVSEQDSFVNRELVNAAARSVKGEIEKVMRQKKFEYAQIEVSMNMSRQQSISISEIIITGVPHESAQKVHDCLKEKLGLEVSVRV